MYTYISKKTSLYGFTMIEIIVSITIIAVLSTLGTMVFTNSLASGRDARRKADLEQLRSALELFRTNNSSAYPTNIPSLTPYLKIPKEGKNGLDYGYYFVAGGNDYTLGALLENVAAPTCAAPGPTCFELKKTNPAARSCNYCVGPYGIK